MVCRVVSVVVWPVFSHVLCCVCVVVCRVMFDVVCRRVKVDVVCRRVKVDVVCRRVMFDVVCVVLCLMWCVSYYV